MSGQMAEQEGKRLELFKRLLPSFSRGRVRSEQSGRSRSELPMTVGTASTREFARRLCPVWALTGSAARPKAFPLLKVDRRCCGGDRCSEVVKRYQMPCPALNSAARSEGRRLISLREGNRGPARVGWCRAPGYGDLKAVGSRLRPGRPDRQRASAVGYGRVGACRSDERTAVVIVEGVS